MTQLGGWVRKKEQKQLQVLRLRRSQGARAPSLRMTLFFVGSKIYRLDFIGSKISMMEGF